MAFNQLTFGPMMWRNKFTLLIMIKSCFEKLKFITEDYFTKRTLQLNKNGNY